MYMYMHIDIVGIANCATHTSSSLTKQPVLRFSNSQQIAEPLEVHITYPCDALPSPHILLILED